MAPEIECGSKVITTDPPQMLLDRLPVEPSDRLPHIASSRSTSRRYLATVPQAALA